MLKRVAHSLGLVEHTHNKDSKSKRKGSKAYQEFSPRSKDFVVSIAHAGGQHEVYRHAVTAYKLMTKYPGMCVARPEVFKLPHQSVLSREDLLMPGHKYILISFKDVEKLKRKHPKEPNGVVEKEAKSPSGHKQKEINGKMKVPNGVALVDAEITMKEPNGVLETRTRVSPSKVVKVNTRVDEYLGGELQDESFIPTIAKDFYLPKEKSTRSSRRRGLRAKKPFVPPLPKARIYRSLGWQPSLPTVKELSP